MEIVSSLIWASSDIDFNNIKKLEVNLAFHFSHLYYEMQPGDETRFAYPGKFSFLISLNNLIIFERHLLFKLIKKFRQP